MTAASKQLKILYLITDLKLGGAQTVLLNIIKYLDTGRFTISVVCLFGGDLPVGLSLRKLDVEVVDLCMTGWWRLDAWFRFYRLLRRRRPDILHASLFHASLLARLVGRLAGVPVILTWRQNINLGSQTREWLNRLTARFDDGIVAVSEVTRQAELRSSGVPPSKVEVIYNCIDIQRYHPHDPGYGRQIRAELSISDDDFLAGVIGRLHPQKGIAFLLEAYAKLTAEVPDAKLLVVGIGELRQDLASLSERLGLKDHVLFTGARNDIPQILAALDVFILPSLWEGLPLAMLEAMSSALPVIATSVGGIPEVLVDGVNGLLVPPADPQALFQAIKKLADKPDLRRQMGQAGRAHIELNFSADQITKKLEMFYLRRFREKGLVR